MQIIPRAIDYFTGKALEYEDFDDDEDFADMDDDDEDDDEFDNDVCLYPVFFCLWERLLISHPASLQDSDSEEELPARRRGPPKGRGAGANQSTNPEECNQQ